MMMMVVEVVEEEVVVGSCVLTQRSHGQVLQAPALPEAQTHHNCMRNLESKADILSLHMLHKTT